MHSPSRDLVILFPSFLSVPCFGPFFRSLPPIGAVVATKLDPNPLSKASFRLHEYSSSQSSGVIQPEEGSILHVQLLAPTFCLCIHHVTVLLVVHNKSYVHVPLCPYLSLPMAKEKDGVLVSFCLTVLGMFLSVNSP